MAPHKRVQIDGWQYMVADSTRTIGAGDRKEVPVKILAFIDPVNHEEIGMVLSVEEAKALANLLASTPDELRRQHEENEHRPSGITTVREMPEFLKHPPDHLGER